jgi:glycosyltransferase involved in cell wall biosynthesis
MKIGYLGSPGLYGHFTLYRNVRTSLAAQGIPIRWIGYGKWGAATAREPVWQNEIPFGEVVAGDSTDQDTIGKAMVRHILDQRYDVIINNIPQDRSLMNVGRYLPDSVRRIIVVGMMGSGTYRLCRAMRDYIHGTVALAPRMRDDLVGQFGFDPKRTIVCGAIDLEPFKNLPARRWAESLRLVYFGRIADGQKGIFHLPAIMEKLSDLDVTLRVIGDGPDLQELGRRCEGFGSRVQFHPPMPQVDIPRVLVEHDVLVFPTRYEGLPATLLEAMAAGCVPVCSHLRGITDYVVRDGESGFLFPVDDAAAAASCVRRLAQDRTLLARCSQAAAADAMERFNSVTSGAAWVKLLNDVWQNPPPVTPPLDLDNWNYPKVFLKGWRHYVPEGLKNIVRAWTAR